MKSELVKQKFNTSILKRKRNSLIGSIASKGAFFSSLSGLTYASFVLDDGLALFLIPATFLAFKAMDLATPFYGNYSDKFAFPKFDKRFVSSLSEVKRYKGFDFRVFNHTNLGEAISFDHSEYVFLLLDLILANPENQKILSEVTAISETDKFKETEYAVQREFYNKRLEPILLEILPEFLEMIQEEIGTKEKEIIITFKFTGNKDPNKILLGKKGFLYDEKEVRNKYHTSSYDITSKVLSNICTYLNTNKLTGNTTNIAKALDENYPDYVNGNKPEKFENVESIFQELEQIKLN